jgi:hypothetical protein
VGGRLKLQKRLSARRAVGLNAFAGAKLFMTEDGRSEDVAVLAGDGRFDVKVGDDGVLLGVRGSGYDAIGYDLGDGGGSRRTFGTGAAAGELTLVGPGAHRVVASAGLRAFDYHPDPDYDWSGDQYGLRYSNTFWTGDPDQDLDAASIELAAGYRLERRNYAGDAFTNACEPGAPPSPSCFAPTELGRVDLFHGFGVEAVYTGARVYGARWELQITDSNSFGQSLVRNRFELSVTTELFAEIYLTAKGVVQLNNFLDPLLLAQDVNAQTFVSIDDENRNAIIVHLSRDLSARWAAELRYEHYRNEFATEDLTFRRHTGYLGLVYDYADD